MIYSLYRFIRYHYLSSVSYYRSYRYDGIYEDNWGICYVGLCFRPVELWGLEEAQWEFDFCDWTDFVIVTPWVSIVWNCF